MSNHGDHNYVKLKPCAFAMSFGVLWSLSLVFCGVLAACCNYGGDFVNLMSSVYLGYDASFTGILAGAVWGFVDGAVGGFLLAWLYNFFSGCSKCCCMKCKCPSNPAGK